jgi:hypothetical protein
MSLSSASPRSKHNSASNREATKGVNNAVADKRLFQNQQSRAHLGLPLNMLDVGRGKKRQGRQDAKIPRKKERPAGRPEIRGIIRLSGRPLPNFPSLLGDLGVLAVLAPIFGKTAFPLVGMSVALAVRSRAPKQLSHGSLIPSAHEGAPFLRPRF